MVSKIVRWVLFIVVLVVIVLPIRILHAPINFIGMISDFFSRRTKMFSKKPIGLMRNRGVGLITEHEK